MQFVAVETFPRVVDEWSDGALPLPQEMKRQRTHTGRTITTWDASRSLLGNGTLVDLRRSRLLEVTAEEVVERGFRHTSVRTVAARARVSTRTFYEHFDGLESCFLAMLDMGPARAGPLILDALAAEGRWQDGIRQAVASVLLFFDSHPTLTRVWFIDSMTAGVWALNRCERHVTLLTSQIVEKLARVGATPEPWVAAGVMAAILGLIHTHLLKEESDPLITLLGRTMGLITTVCLDRASVELEIERGEQLARVMQEERSSSRSNTSREHQHSPAAPRRREELALDLLTRYSRRVCECLLLLGDRSGLSNRAVAQRLGIRHSSQVSRLLAQLLDEGLVLRHSHGVGKANEWQLTPHGETVRQELVSHQIFLERGQTLRR